MISDLVPGICYSTDKMSLQEHFNDHVRHIKFFTYTFSAVTYDDNSLIIIHFCIHFVIATAILQ